MKKQFELLKATRNNILKVTEGLSDEQLLKIPAGFNNNILWNMGHVITSTERLTYVLSGLPMKLSDAYVTWFIKGSDPKQWTQMPSVEEVKALLLSTPDRLQEDYGKGIFKNYKEYPTSYGYLLKNIEEAIAFSVVHEAMHLGNIQSMKKLL